MSVEQIGTYGLEFICLLFSLSVHEAAHAIMANRCGDPTGRLMGRATLNPLAHIDPIGTVLLPLVAIFTRLPVFGWAKPVPFNPRNLRNIRRDPALIGLAGPFANLMLVLTGAVALKITVLVLGVGPLARVSQGIALDGMDYLVLGLILLIQINLILMLFNMIPVPPLDGHHLLGSLLPYRGQQVLEQIGPFGLLLALFVFAPMIRGPLDFLMSKVIWYALLGT